VWSNAGYVAFGCMVIRGGEVVGWISQIALRQNYWQAGRPETGPQTFAGERLSVIPEVASSVAWATRYKSRNECMHKGCALGLVALMILCSPVGSVTAKEKKPANAIRVLEATYGGNCEGVTKGNVTKFIASTCDGTDLCNYHVYYKKMGGDPAAGCKKAFRVTFVCGKNTKNPDTCALEAEAGKGGEDGEANNFCLLHCLSEGSRERRTAKSKEEGTRRTVDRRPLTAPSATPNTQPSAPQWQWR
jgi:hypothetical protein